MCGELTSPGVPSHTANQGGSFLHGSLRAKVDLPDLANWGYPEFQIIFFSTARVTFYLVATRPECLEALFVPSLGREGTVGSFANCQDEKVREMSSISHLVQGPPPRALTSSWSVPGMGSSPPHTTSGP